MPKTKCDKFPTKKCPLEKFEEKVKTMSSNRSDKKEENLEETKIDIEQSTNHIETSHPVVEPNYDLKKTFIQNKMHIIKDEQKDLFINFDENKLGV